MWMRAQYPAASVYGIVGMQIAVFEVGRYTVPAIGVMAVMMPDGEGGHDWRPATTLAFGYRLSDFVVPFLRRPASLHLNVARTSIHGVNDAAVRSGNDALQLFRIVGQRKKAPLIESPANPVTVARPQRSREGHERQPRDHVMRRSA